MPTRYVVSALERFSSPIDTSDPDAGWIPEASHNNPAIDRYLARLGALPGIEKSQHVELYGNRVVTRITADDTPEAASLLAQIAADPYIEVLPASLINEPLGQWTQAQRDALIDQLRGGWETSAADPLSIEWNPTGGYPLQRIAQRYGLAADATLADVRAELATRTLREVVEFLAAFQRKRFFDGTRVGVGAERPGGQPVSALE